MSKDKSDKAAKKAKKGKKGDAAAGAPQPDFSISGDARAKQSVRQIKAAVGLLGFGIALFLSLHASVPLAISGERALIAGIAGYLIAWACAVAVWRAVLMAELRARVDEIRAARERAAGSAAK